MTATATRARPYRSGWCASARPGHRVGDTRCRRDCGTRTRPVQCSCSCHTEEEEEEAVPVAAPYPRSPAVCRSCALTAVATGQVPQCAAAALRALLTTDVRKGATA